MSMVFQVVDIFGFFCPPKINSIFIKQLAECDSDGKNNKVYLKIAYNFKPLVNIRIRLYVS